mmetsp:Transcript_78074/g.196213  ORF Transcript_78074/g.196213 Transcript_78074/m.196213 type:complete len:106 (-) Transcript_78074:1017-1334(-)
MLYSESTSPLMKELPLDTDIIGFDIVTEVAGEILIPLSCEISSFSSSSCAGTLQGLAVIDEQLAPEPLTPHRRLPDGLPEDSQLAEDLAAQVVDCHQVLRACLAL